MSKRKGPQDENVNGKIVDFLMGMYHVMCSVEMWRFIIT